MAIVFDWREVAEFEWSERYQIVFDRLEGQVAGIRAWKDFLGRRLHVVGDPDQASSLVAERLHVFQANVESDNLERHNRKRLCVFVSHRQSDVAEAVEIADAIDRHGRFDIWLDIWDRDLQSIFNTRLSNSDRALQTAMTIEMALINSLRVIAIVTDNSSGSAWIPYEFGRVRFDLPYCQNAATCIQGPITHVLPEYMLLGPIIYRENDRSLRDWLDGWPP